MLQNSALAALGVFVFTRQTVPFQSFDRQSSWRHPTNSVVGQMPKTQFTGKDSETVTISGRLIPEITGGTLSLTMLELMAESGAAFPLIEGANFMVMGFFVIESIQETRTELFGDGTARAIDFTLNLKRTDDPLLIELAQNIMGAF
ncbi:MULTISPECIES: phage tail protein [Rodentibacter]|uniref:Oxidoreductase n=1 Tax=Rodentibacter pneumotropicus TaxID=758 RepID=A0A4S2P6I0_9PAST|nr:MULTISPECIES: phage tail protein [Pasteurellaceae]TGY50814.1 phage tail protein [Pasteurella caecimuris]TGZ98508.1 oxidoreductase [Rodentibacter pneumotropicus]THA00958.1 oxidoreductase [Rodentibacter pneumotropicus]THA08182.1 oxidoreductase [Rodentibacter pneumotropicus]THA09127.1 oxidoreductase [Rodentibacter pneumotropicus]